MNGPVQNGKDFLISAVPGTLPNMHDTLLDYFLPITFVRVTKEDVNFSVKETREEIECMGVVQPMSPQQLSIKPIGQREWKWYTIHAFPNLILNPDDIIKFVNILADNENYRVMAKMDWKSYGYVEYHIVKDYENPA